MSVFFFGIEYLIMFVERPHFLSLFLSPITSLSLFLFSVICQWMYLTFAIDSVKFDCNVLFFFLDTHVVTQNAVHKRYHKRSEMALNEPFLYDVPLLCGEWLSNYATM